VSYSPPLDSFIRKKSEKSKRSKKMKKTDEKEKGAMKAGVIVKCRLLRAWVPDYAGQDDYCDRAVHC
jgi:hypothetical protein